MAVRKDTQLAARMTCRRVEVRLAAVLMGMLVREDKRSLEDLVALRQELAVEGEVEGQGGVVS